MIDTQQKVKLADLQIDQLTRVQKHTKLTHAEITTLPDNTRLYEGVGRMWVSMTTRMSVYLYTNIKHDYSAETGSKQFLIKWNSTQVCHQVSTQGFISRVCFRFILQSKEDINNQLMDKQKTADEKIKELEVQLHTEIYN